MITYNWIINSMVTAPLEDGLTDVVKTVNWTYQEIDIDNGKTYMAEVYGTMPCSSPNPTDFTAYPDLTEAQVIGWLEAGLNVSELQGVLNLQIQNQINPTTVILPLPFTNP